MRTPTGVMKRTTNHQILNQRSGRPSSLSDILREDASKVELKLEFEFTGRIMNAAFGAVFSQIANSMVDAFCKRAGEIYGK